MSTNFTTAQLATLEAAIAAGVLSVQYTDKKITYASMTDMLRARDLMRRCLGLTAKVTRIYPKHSKGLEGE